METVIPTLIAVRISAASSWIMVQLSLWRFFAEKLWEMRGEAYKRLIEAFHESKAFLDAHVDVANIGRDLPKETDAKLFARSKDAASEIARAADFE